MQFLFYFAVCLGSFLLSLQLFTSTTTKKGPAEDLFFGQFNRQAEASRPYSTQGPATKPAPAPEMIESTRDVSAAPLEMATATPDVSAAMPEMATPDAAAAAPEMAAAPSEMATATPDVATATPDVAAAKPDTRSDPLVAGQPKTKLIPKIVTNARAEAAPKRKRVARKYPGDDDPRNPIWWLWGLSDVR